MDFQMLQQGTFLKFINIIIKFKSVEYFSVDLTSFVRKIVFHFLVLLFSFNFVFKIPGMKVFTFNYILHKNFNSTGTKLKQQINA